MGILRMEERLPLWIAGGVGFIELGLVLIGLLRSYPNPERVTQTFALSAIGILGLLVFWFIPELGIGLYLFNGIFKTAAIFGDPDSIVPTLFVLGLTIGVLFVKFFAIRRAIRIDLLLAPLLALNFLIISSALATGIPGALEKALRLGFFTGMSFILAYLITLSPKHLLLAFRYAALLSTVTAVMSIVAFVSTTTGVRSVTLFASNDVIFGRTLALGILISIGLFLYDQTLSLGWRWFLAASLPIALVSLVLSTSRGATVGLVGAVAFGLLIHRRRPPLWIFGVIGAGALAYLYVTEMWGSRVIDLSNFSFFTGQGQLDMSTRQRLVMYENAYRNYIANPLLGIGTQSNASYPHNIFLEVASELGTVGLSLFLLLGWQIYTKVRRLLQQQHNAILHIVAQLTAISLVYSLIIAQFSGNLQHQRPLWLFVAVIWALPISTGSTINNAIDRQNLSLTNNLEDDH